MLTTTSVIPEIKDYTIKDLNTEVLVTNEKMETVIKMTITFRVDYRSAKTEYRESKRLCTKQLQGCDCVTFISLRPPLFQRK